MAKIFVKNLRVSGILGIHEHEQQTPQTILVNAVVKADISAAAENDDIHQTVNYSTMAKMIAKTIQESHFLTVEALVTTLADQILEDQRVKKVWLRVEKPEALTDADSVGVEITRSR
jgi:7,8-dihydroneopterin aldolase/epimerase/oxygenase